MTLITIEQMRIRDLMYTIDLSTPKGRLIYDYMEQHIFPDCKDVHVCYLCEVANWKHKEGSS